MASSKLVVKKINYWFEVTGVEKQKGTLSW
jgi:hypothetical protein